MYGEDSPSPYRIITTLRRTERTLASALEEALRAVDLTAAQFHVLEELTVTEVLHVGELAWRLRVTRQSMHGIVQNLARAHLVKLAPKEHGSRNLWLRWRWRTARAPALRDRTIGGGQRSRWWWD
jgi:DNA-binding MarR family transcriptional regulator